jgi:hypothetical protein
MVGRLSDNVTLDLYALACEVCRRYRLEFPDEVLRYGDVRNAWCESRSGRPCQLW